MKEWYIVEDDLLMPEVHNTPPKDVDPEHVFKVVEKKYFDSMKAQNESLLKQIAKLQVDSEQKAVEIGSLDFKLQKEIAGHKEYSQKYYSLRYACDWLIEVVGGVGVDRWRRNMMAEYERRLKSTPPPVRKL